MDLEMTLGRPLCSRAFQPNLPGFLVPVLVRSTGKSNLVWRHRRVANDDDFVVVGILVNDVEDVAALAVTTDVVLPNAFVNGPKGSEGFLFPNLHPVIPSRSM